jgi:MFS family permease
MNWMVAVSLLGLAQIASWGTLYYTLGVLSPAMARDTGTSELMLFGAFSGALLLAGILAPRVGSLIDSSGARPMLSGGSLLAAATFAMLATAQGPWSLMAAWMVGGFAIATTLYDAGFAAVNQVTREHYRRAVTGLTLFGGFASTVFWPATHALQQAIGWRDTLWLYAILHLIVCAPLHWVVLPNKHAIATAPRTKPDGSMPLHAASCSGYRSALHWAAR